MFRFDVKTRITLGKKKSKFVTEHVFSGDMEQFRNNMTQSNKHHIQYTYYIDDGICENLHETATSARGQRVKISMVARCVQDKLMSNKTQLSRERLWGMKNK